MDFFSPFCIRKEFLSGVKGSDVSKQDAAMNKQSKSDLYQGLFPIYYLSKGFGLLPVRFSRQTNGRYSSKMHMIDIFYGVCLLLLFICAEIWGLWRDLRDGWVHSTRLKHQATLNVTIGDVVAVALIAAVGVLGAPFRWKYIEEIMGRLIDADEKIGFINAKKTRRFAIIISTSALCYLITISSLDIYVWDVQTKLKRKMADKGPINYSPIYFLCMQALVIEIQYTVTTYNLNERFLRLNKNLESLLKTGRHFTKKDMSFSSESKDRTAFTVCTRTEVEARPARVFRTPKVSDWTVGEGEIREMTDTFSQLITVHSSICDTNVLLNKAFGLPILVVTITCLLHLIITPYFLMIEANSDKEALFIAVQLGWCVFHIFRMLIVVQPCYATTTESKRTAVLVSQLLTYNWEPDVRKQLELFSLQLLHRPLDFTACGLFSLDRALVTSMAGAVTTYLVILIQFQKADDTKDENNNILKNATLLLQNVSSLHNSTSLKTVS
ncbi:gustatory receptor for sugar taste 43a isoform X2 [Fopius arisanus]|uniref:Gustatory receptor n=1 Tax=Fopius arisanus TaxID=64838 RepID=A0A9R1U475_9HYME|nr:PREDICTED: gustatory receptor for sugar taste 43a-like isoform X2 [Fopius arisanus]